MTINHYQSGTSRDWAERHRHRNARLLLTLMLPLIGNAALATPTIITVGNLLCPDAFNIRAESEGGAGNRVVDIGDFNGDGRSDVLVTSTLYSPPGTQFAGRACVIYRPPPTLCVAPIELATVQNGISGFCLVGETAGALTGTTATGLGDFNNDGKSDVAIGDAAARVSVVFGTSVPFTGPLLPSTLNGSNGFRVASAFLPTGIGDINSDGFGDFVFDPFGGAQRYCVIFGKASGIPAEFNPFTPNGSNGFCVSGPIPQPPFTSATFPFALAGPQDPGVPARAQTLDPTPPGFEIPDPAVPGAVAGSYFNSPGSEGHAFIQHAPPSGTTYSANYSFPTPPAPVTVLNWQSGAVCYEPAFGQCEAPGCAFATQPMMVGCEGGGALIGRAFVFFDVNALRGVPSIDLTQPLPPALQGATFIAGPGESIREYDLAITDTGRLMAAFVIGTGADFWTWVLDISDIAPGAQINLDRANPNPLLDGRIFKFDNANTKVVVNPEFLPGFRSRSALQPDASNSDALLALVAGSAGTAIPASVFVLSKAMWAGPPPDALFRNSFE